MEINLIFQPRNDERPIGNRVTLQGEETALIPGIGDHIIVNGKPQKVRSRFFNFIAGHADVHFEFE